MWICTCWIGEFAYPSDITQTFWRNVCNIRCFAMVSCATRWHILNFRPMKIDWTCAKICIMRFHVVTQQLSYTPELHVDGWNRYECLKKYQKMISRSLIALNFTKLCGICGIFQIMRDYVEMKLCDSASAHNSVEPGINYPHLNEWPYLTAFKTYHWGMPRPMIKIGHFQG